MAGIVAHATPASNPRPVPWAYAARLNSAVALRLVDGFAPREGRPAGQLADARCQRNPAGDDRWS